MSPASGFLLLVLGPAWGPAVRLPPDPPVTVRFDYGGAEALLDALDRPALTPAEVDRLMEVRGLAAMVDNTTQYLKTHDRARFRADLAEFLRDRRAGQGHFGLARVHGGRETVRATIAALRKGEGAVTRELLARLEPYRPRTGPLAATVYFVAGGTSDGFVPPGSDEPAFFVALDKAGSDLAGLRQNMAHELYHVLQRAAAKRAGGVAADARDQAKLPPPERLVAATLLEGVANYVADAREAEGRGPYLEMWQGIYRRNAEPARVRENFALFDRLLADLRAGRVTWEEADRKGFWGHNDARLYFVGYEMAKALERHRGADRIREYAALPPADFFRDYVALYQGHPAIAARFSKETEAFLGAKSRPRE